MNDPDIEKAIKEAIDACRPGADDANQPEMSALADVMQEDEQVREWYDRTQQSDAAIGRVFRDVPVPEGLVVRLVAAVQNAETESGQESSSFVSEAVAEQGDLTAEASIAPSATHHKRWKYVFAGVSIATIISLCLLLFLTGSPDVTPEQLPIDVNEWINEVVVANDWNGDFSEAPVQDYPPDPAVRADVKQWRVAQTRYDSQATVYDISRGQGYAYLFCIRAKGNVIGLPKVPPVDPQWTTGGVAIGVWQRAGMVYVLVVERRKQQYQSFIGPSMII